MKRKLHYIVYYKTDRITGVVIGQCDFLVGTDPTQNSIDWAKEEIEESENIKRNTIIITKFEVTDSYFIDEKQILKD